MIEVRIFPAHYGCWPTSGDYACEDGLLFRLTFTEPSIHKLTQYGNWLWGKIDPDPLDWSLVGAATKVWPIERQLERNVPPLFRAEWEV